MKAENTYCRKIYIRSKEDLPQKKGSYFARCVNTTQKFYDALVFDPEDTFFWETHVIWYLLPDHTIEGRLAVQIEANDMLLCELRELQKKPEISDEDLLQQIYDRNDMTVLASSDLYLLGFENGKSYIPEITDEMLNEKCQSLFPLPYESEIVKQRMNDCRHGFYSCARWLLKYINGEKDDDTKNNNSDDDTIIAMGR